MAENIDEGLLPLFFFPKCPYKLPWVISKREKMGMIWPYNLLKWCYSRVFGEVKKHAGYFWVFSFLYYAGTNSFIVLSLSLLDLFIFNMEVRWNMSKYVSLTPVADKVGKTWGEVGSFPTQKGLFLSYMGNWYFPV